MQHFEHYSGNGNSITNPSRDMGKFSGNNDIQCYAAGAQRQIPTLNVINSILVLVHMENIIIGTNRKH